MCNTVEKTKQISVIHNIPLLLLFIVGMVLILSKSSDEQTEAAEFFPRVTALQWHEGAATSTLCHEKVAVYI